ncbi:MAG: helix-turn-helix domain-containing protein [Chloroflexi bacterium]|nr:helix-turn-helix domain-containing protein [Chloroflexota bacterium]
MAGLPGQRGVQSVDRALELLETIAREGAPLAITTLATRTGLHVSTAHRLLATLVARGYVSHDDRTHRYGPGPNLGRLVRDLGTP